MFRALQRIQPALFRVTKDRINKDKLDVFQDSSPSPSSQAFKYNKVSKAVIIFSEESRDSTGFWSRCYLQLHLRLNFTSQARGIFIVDLDSASQITFKYTFRSFEDKIRFGFKRGVQKVTHYWDLNGYNFYINTICMAI